MNNNAGIGQPSPLLGAISWLGDRVKVLEEAVGTLHTRLEPLLGQGSEDATTPKETPSLSCMAVDSLQRGIDGIDAISARVRNICERLQV